MMEISYSRSVSDIKCVPCWIWGLRASLACGRPQLNKSRASLSCHGGHGLVRITDMNPCKVAAEISDRKEQYVMPESQL